MLDCGYTAYCGAVRWLHTCVASSPVSTGHSPLASIRCPILSHQKKIGKINALTDRVVAPPVTEADGGTRGPICYTYPVSPACTFAPCSRKLQK
eukprot:788921-Amphidinium_carterae.1